VGRKGLGRRAIFKILQRLLIAAAVLAPASGVRAQSPAVAEMEAVYDFYLGGLQAGELAVSADFGAGNYNASSELRTTGIIGLFYKLAFDAAVVGRVDPGGLFPERYTSDTSSPKRRQSIEIAFKDGTPVSSRVRPVRRAKSYSINPRDQSGTVDPLSALLTAFTPAPADAVCEQRVDVYDGRRRFALEIEEPKRERTRIRCEANYIRLAGFKPKWLGKNAARPFTLFFDKRADGLFEVVRAVIDTPYGAAILRLRK
jgi:hypothetical protein